MEEVLIAGGGIGGLAAALALGLQGRSVRVLERSHEFSEIGYGLQLGPNAFHMLRRLGVGEELQRTACFPKHLVMMDAIDGREITRMDLGAPFVERFGAPYAVIHRSDLLNLLLQACRALPDVTLQTGSDLVEFKETGNAVDVQLADGRCHRGGALIGADGLRSLVRDALHGSAPPQAAGQVAFRGVVPIEEIPDRRLEDDVVLWVGHDMHMVQYRLRGGAVMNTVAVIEHAGLRSQSRCDIGPELLQKGFAQAVPTVQRMLDFVGQDRHWVLCDRQPAPGWSRGRVTLLGDAAHPTLQYLAQGACMALEDAVALGDLAQAPGELHSRFADYEQARYLRTARVQLTSRFFCGVCHAGGAQRDVRNAILRGRAHARYPEVDWLYAPASPHGAAAQVAA